MTARSRSAAATVGAFFEAHIEQGPILEREKKTIGVVTGAQGQRWYEINWTGMESHAGTTPMEGRRDALVGAAELIVGCATDRQHGRTAARHGRRDREPAAVAQHHPRPRVHDGRLPPSRRCASCTKMDAEMRAAAADIAARHGSR